MIIKGLRHIALLTSKMELMREFYENLGLKVIRDYVGEGEFFEKLLGLFKGSKIRHIYLRAPDGNIIQLVDNGCPHIAVQVDKIDGGYVSPEGVRVKIINDPDGNKLELVEIEEKLEWER